MNEGMDECCVLGPAGKTLGPLPYVCCLTGQMEVWEPQIGRGLAAGMAHRGESESGEQRRDTHSDMRKAGEVGDAWVGAAGCAVPWGSPYGGVHWRELVLNESLFPRTTADSRVGLVALVWTVPGSLTSSSERCSFPGQAGHRQRGHSYDPWVQREKPACSPQSVCAKLGCRMNEGCDMYFWLRLFSIYHQRSRGILFAF